MAKALIGHVGRTDPRALMEMRRLHDQVRELEAEVRRLRVENDALVSSVTETHLIALEATKEPALA